METALTDPRKTEVNADFHVSTALFASRFETRVFTTNDDVPTALVTAIMEQTYETLEKVFASSDARYCYDDDNDGSPVGFTGVAVESYGFSDADTVHSDVVKLVRQFLATHTRTVVYTPNEND
jgi:hypothetical protein